MTSPAELQAQADAFGWYHTIDLGNGVVTKGISVQETSAGVIPDVAGKSVLDIGAWDGKFSFLAEQHGASRVVALDHYAWGVDFVARGAYWEECINERRAPGPVARRDRLLAARPAGSAWLQLRRQGARLQGRAGGGRLPARSTSTSWAGSTSCCTSACCTT